MIYFFSFFCSSVVTTQFFILFFTKQSGICTFFPFSLWLSTWSLACEVIWEFFRTETPSLVCLSPHSSLRLLRMDCMASMRGKVAAASWRSCVCLRQFDLNLALSFFHPFLFKFFPVALAWKHVYGVNSFLFLFLYGWKEGANATAIS